MQNVANKNKAVKVVITTIVLMVILAGVIGLGVFLGRNNNSDIRRVQIYCVESTCNNSSCETVDLGAMLQMVNGPEILLSLDKNNYYEFEIEFLNNEIENLEYVGVGEVNSAHTRSIVEADGITVIVNKKSNIAKVKFTEKFLDNTPNYLFFNSGQTNVNIGFDLSLDGVIVI